MKIIFFGSSEFAVSSLEMLSASRHEITAVVTQPDRKQGRHLHEQPLAVKKFALERGLRVFQPQELDAAFLSSIKELNADLFVVAAYGKILRREILEAPRIFAVNVHGSLLPKYRGAAPVNWALIRGEDVTGATIMKMNERIDEGEIILKEAIKIEEDDDALTLGGKVSGLGAKLLLEALNLIEEKKFTLTPQTGASSFAPKLKKEDGLIRWDSPAIEIHRRIRGLVPWPGTYTYYKGKMLKVHKARVLDEMTEMPGSEGCVVDINRDSGIVVQTKRGLLSVLELQFEGGKKLDAWSFEAGHRLRVGESFLA